MFWSRLHPNASLKFTGIFAQSWLWYQVNQIFWAYFPLSFILFYFIYNISVQQCKEGADVLPEEIKVELLHSAGFHETMLLDHWWGCQQHCCILSSESVNASLFPCHGLCHQASLEVNSKLITCVYKRDYICGHSLKQGFNHTDVLSSVISAFQ